jgi:hypothetical protein
MKERYQIGNNKKCQVVKRKDSSSQSLPLFENKRYTCKMTKGHLFRVEMKKREERCKKDRSSDFCLLSSPRMSIEVKN